MQRVIEFRGLGVYPGEYTGRVKLVFKLEDLEKIERGDVIVAPMTNPDMTIAFGKVGAIITDAGGLASHAAIIARELKIPAVVGTGIATKLLQDGMIVHIDATNGIVKIISDEDIEIPIKLNEANEVYTIFGNKCPVVKIKTPSKDPFFQRVLDIPWQDPPDEIYVIAPRAEIKVTPLTGSLILPAIERLPYALGFSDIGPLYAYIIDGILYVAYEKISRVMEKSKTILFDEKNWNLYLENLYEKYNLFTKATQEFKKKIEEGKDFGEILEKNFTEWWKFHNMFFSQTFLIQAWGDDIIYPMIKAILRKYYSEEQSTTLLYSLTKLSEQIPSVKFYSDFQALIPKIPATILEKLISDNDSDKLQAFEEIKENPHFKEFMEKWYWVRDRDLWEKDLRDPYVFSRFVKLLHDSKPLQEESSPSLSTIISKMNSEDSKNLEYFVNVGRILKKERDYHHFLWLKNTAPIKDFFLMYGADLVRKGILKEPEDILLFWLPEIYKLEEGDLSKEEAKDIILIRKKHYEHIR